MKYSKENFLNGVILTFTPEVEQAINADMFSTIGRLTREGKLLEEVDCVLCGNTKKEFILKHTDGCQLSKCLDCGLVYANKRPTKETLYILQKYYVPSVVKDAEIQQQNAENKLREFEFELKLLEELKPNKGFMLDVGMASGDFLFYARQEGWCVAGTELSLPCIRLTTEVFKIHALFGELHSINIEDSLLDVITMRHVIEHLRHPIKDLETAYKALKDDGILLITTPYFAKSKESLEKNHMLPLHIVDFSPETLTKIVEKVGFKIKHFGFEVVTEEEIDKNMLMLVGK